jgi:hypothetical protein
MKTKWVFLCGAGAVLTLAVTVLASREVRPPSRAEVIGVWSGYTDHLDFLRLELDEDGKGFLCVAWVPGDKPQLYRVEKWDYADWHLGLAIKPIDSGAEPVYLTNTVCGYEDLRCEFGGGEWKRKATLLCDREWNRRSKPLEQRIEQFRRSKR